MMKAIISLSWLGLIAAGATAADKQSTGRSASKPNVPFIAIDDLRPETAPSVPSARLDQGNHRLVNHKCSWK